MRNVFVIYAIIFYFNNEAKFKSYHFQANKFEGVNNPLAKEFIQQIKSAKSPEEAARLGRKLQRQHPEMVCLYHAESVLRIVVCVINTFNGGDIYGYMPNSINLK